MPVIRKSQKPQLRSSMQKRYHESLLIPVWVRAASLPLLACALTGVSDGDAELKIYDPSMVPDHFDLFFSPNAQSWRECSVNWREYQTKSVGIIFLGRHMAARSSVTEGSNSRGDMTMSGLIIE
jgi:hypothetical protein